MTNTDIASATSIMLGTTQASAVYIGNTLVWSNNTVPYDAEIEYLEGTGTLWIDTLIHPTTGYGFELYGGFTEFNNNEFFGGGTGWSNGLGICTRGSGAYGIIVGLTEVCQISAENNVMHLFRVNTDGTVYVDSEYKGQSTTSMPEGDYTMYIFNHSSTKAIRKAKIYYCKIFNSNGLVFDGIPVRVGLIGYMYDRVSRLLFSNEGSGNFVLGPDKLPSGYTEVEYIASTLSGSLYIDLDIMLYDTLNKNYDIAIKFNALNTGSDNTTQPTIFGCQDNTGSPWPGTFIRRAGSDNTIVGRYIGGSDKDNTIGTMNSIIELTEKTPPAKNVYNYNNSGRTHTWGTSLFCIFNNLAKTARIRYIEARLYYFKLFVEGTLVRDMVPCINPNNVVGLYDLVNNVFYSSPNGAAFVAGSAV